MSDAATASEVEPTFFLDANVAIALTVDSHEHHPRAIAWLAQVEHVALCPIVEGALIRYLLRIGSSSADVAAILRQVRGLSNVVFRPDSLSYAQVPMNDVRGHRQVTDVYLATLAASYGARLATFDVPLTLLRPEHTFLIPELRDIPGGSSSSDLSE